MIILITNFYVINFCKLARIFLDIMLAYLSFRDLIPGKGDDLAGQMAIQKVAVGYAVLKR